MSSVQRLAREIYDTQRLALGHATHPQLNAASLEGGGIPITDGNGSEIGRIGVGDDGAFSIDHVAGPKPPKPTVPTVTSDAGMIRVEYDGKFADSGDAQDVIGTADLDRVEIHASQDENFVPDRVMSFGGAFATLDGGSFALGPLADAGTWYVRLLARSKAGKFSEPSDLTEVEVAVAGVDLEIVNAWLTGEAAQTTADGKNSIFRGGDEPVLDPEQPFKDGDIWFEMTEDGKSIPNQWDEATQKWVGVDDYRQSEIERVQNELRKDLDSVIVDGSGTKNFYQSEPPVDGMAEGDLWFDTDDNDKPHIYTAGAWSPIARRVTDEEIADGAITAPKIATGAITAESGIIGSINAGTITSGEMEGARIKAGTVTADTVLVKGSLGSTVIRDGAIITSKIAAGAITAESGIIGSIDANTITVGKIMGNQLDADAINGKTITGATIRTASSGARVELTQNGLKQYNALNQVIADMSQGRLDLLGNISQRNAVGKLEVGPAWGGATTAPGLTWTETANNPYPAGVAVVQAKSTDNATLAFMGPARQSQDHQPLLNMSDRTIYMWSQRQGADRSYMYLEQASAGLRRDKGSGGGWAVLADDASYFTWSHPTNAGSSYLRVQDRSFRLEGYDSNQDLIGGLWSTPDGTVLSAYKRSLELWGGDGARMIFGKDQTSPFIYSTTIYNRTYSGQSDVCITSYGTLGRRTSARKYKLDERVIEPESYAEALLSIDHKSWIDKGERDRSRELAKYRNGHPMAPATADFGEAVSSEELPRHVGAIADDFDAAGLGQFVIYDEFGEIEGLRYDLIGVALIPILRAQRDRIEALEARLAA